MKSEPASTSHIVGPAIGMLSASRGRIRRQRCLWCGVLLDELELDRIAVLVSTEDPAPSEPGKWEAGAVLRQFGDNPKVSVIVEVGLDDPLPDDCCGNLDYEVTQ